MMQNKGIFILCFQIIVELSKYTSGFQNGTTDDYKSLTEMKSIHSLIYQAKDRKGIYKEDVIIFPYQAKARSMLFYLDSSFFRSSDCQNAFYWMAAKLIVMTSLFVGYGLGIVIFSRSIFGSSDCQMALDRRTSIILVMHSLMVGCGLVIIVIFSRSTFGSSDCQMALDRRTSITLVTHSLIGSSDCQMALDSRTSIILVMHSLIVGYGLGIVIFSGSIFDSSDCQMALDRRTSILLVMHSLIVGYGLVIVIFSLSIFGSSDCQMALDSKTSIILVMHSLIVDYVFGIEIFGRSIFELYFQRSLEIIELFVRTALSKSGVREEELIEWNLWIYSLGKPDDSFALATILLMCILHVGLIENGTHKYGILTNDMLSYSQILKITTKETRKYQPQKTEEEAVRHCGLCVNHYQAVAFCKTCKLYICFSCNDLHKRVWTFMNHTVCPFHHNDGSQLN